MNPVCVADHIESLDKAEDTNTVGTIKVLQFQLYLESSLDFDNSACHVLIVVL